MRNGFVLSVLVSVQGLVEAPDPLTECRSGFPLLDGREKLLLASGAKTSLPFSIRAFDGSVANPSGVVVLAEDSTALVWSCGAVCSV